MCFRFIFEFRNCGATTDLELALEAQSGWPGQWGKGSWASPGRRSCAKSCGGPPSPTGWQYLPPGPTALKCWETGISPPGVLSDNSSENLVPHTQTAQHPGNPCVPHSRLLSHIHSLTRWNRQTHCAFSRAYGCLSVALAETLTPALHPVWGKRRWGAPVFSLLVDPTS